MPNCSNYQAIIPAPFATLGLKLDKSALIELDFIFEDVSIPKFENEIAELVGEQIQHYLADPSFKFNFNISPHGTHFQKAVWLQMQDIPSGQYRSYGEVAKNLKSGARAVGNACRKNPIPLIIPCHRILAKNGIGGFAGKTSGQLINVKQWLLNHESKSIN